jgi:hypothetical protein
MSLDQYKEHRGTIISTLSSVYGISEKDAEDLLTSNKITKTLEFGLELFAEDGRITREL